MLMPLRAASTLTLRARASEITAEAVALEVGRRTGVLVTPAQAFGMAEHHLGFAGTMSLQPSTLLAVMHDLSAALAADRVLVLDEGRLVADGAPGDPALRERLVQVFGAAFSIEPVRVHGRERWVVVPAL